jgi:uncharacterized membrane protein
MWPFWPKSEFKRMSSGEPSKFVREINGRLHSITEIRDKAGKLISHVASPLKVELKFEDVVQLIVGALVLGVPIALTEEVWDLGDTLPAGRLYLIAGLSLVINGFFVKMLFYRDNLAEYWVDFIKRVFTAYGIALLVALMLLGLFDMGLLEDPVLALRRAVIIAFPASFAATAVDFIR